MDKTININLGGTMFSIDEEAYGILKNYLREIDNKFRNQAGGNETIEDIEARIAELLYSKKGNAGVITKENIEEIILTIGKPEDFETEGEKGESRASSYGNPGPRTRLYRNPENSVVSGVCGGIGAYLNSDPVWIRILFVLFAFAVIGIFVYIALWIALPVAATDSQKHEMYGGSHNWAMPQEWDRKNGNRLGHAINEVFRAIGKVFFVIFRIFMIVFGTLFVVTGFMALLAFVMIVVFKYPGAFSADIEGVNLCYIPDFMRYIVAPSAVPWIIGLFTAAFVIPFSAMIYGGIRLIFWFRVRDGLVWLTALILWVLSITALSIILASEGVNYGSRGRISTSDVLTIKSDTLNIISYNKLSDIKTPNEILLPDNGGDGYLVYVNDEKKELYIKSHVGFELSEDKDFHIIITKMSAGRNRMVADEKAEKLQYRYTLEGNKLSLDEYFTIPASQKWAVDFVSVSIMVPQGKMVHTSRNINETILRSEYNRKELEGKGDLIWKVTEEGPEIIPPAGK